MNPFPYEINGSFKNGALIKGETVMPDGSKYAGEFRNLMPHGEGTMRYLNNNEYRGEFFNGDRSGYGRFFDRRDNSMYEGEFKHNQFNGEGKYMLADGSSFKGTFINGVLNS